MSIHGWDCDFFLLELSLPLFTDTTHRKRQHTILWNTLDSNQKTENPSSCRAAPVQGDIWKLVGLHIEAYGSASGWLSLWTLHEYNSVAGYYKNDLSPSAIFSSLCAWGRHIFSFSKSSQDVAKIFGLLMLSHFKTNAAQQTQGSPKFPLLTCISKTLAYRCQDCSPTRKLMAFICAWRFMTSKKFHTFPKQLQCFTSESSTSNIYHFTLSSTFDRVTWLFSLFAQIALLGRRFF